MALGPAGWHGACPYICGFLVSLNIVKARENSNIFAIFARSYQ
jgi:hypothetical protein